MSPRRKPKAIEQELDAPPLMLAPPRPSSRHEHEVDAYATPPGAIPIQTTTEPLKRKLTAADAQELTERRQEAEMRAERYNRFLDVLVEKSGDEDAALAAVYELTVEAVRLRKGELLADVRAGIVSSSIGDTLERNHLSEVARIAILRRHAYSNNPAASLKAVDMVQDMSGNRSDAGSFESYLRVLKGKR